MSKLSGRKIFLLLFLVITLPLSLLAIKKVQDMRGKAEIIAPNIAIDAGSSLGPYNNPMCALSQGGEVDKKGGPVSFSDVAVELARIRPCFIRIDHIYDIYTKVSLENNNVIIDWTILDKTVDDILKTGAKPFLSLSYMPPAIAKEGELTGEPNSWNLWKELVRKTVEHFSGKNYRNIENVYYEVWNEPDLFGNFRIGGAKDYRTLYHYAVLGAKEANNANQFFIGGPSTTQPLKNWTTGFVDFVQKEGLRLDFLSYHKYSFTPSDLISDANKIDTWLDNYPGYKNIPIFITEWGSNSENSDTHDSVSDALHTLATATYLDNRIKNVFSFEIKDGPSPLKKQYWGRWGLFTNEEFGLIAKPRFLALDYLSEIRGERLDLQGNGTNVSALALRDGKSYKVLVVYYLPPNQSSYRNLEAVPITFANLPKGIYSFRQEGIFTSELTVAAEKIGEGRLTKVIGMIPNSAFLITLTREKELASFTSGRLGGSDEGLMFDEVVPNLTFQEDKISSMSGTVEYYANFKYPISSLKEEPLLAIPLSDGTTLIAKKRSSVDSFGTEIVLGIFNNTIEVNGVSGAVTSWKAGEWHHIAISWNTTSDNKSLLKLYLDGKPVNRSLTTAQLEFAKQPFIVGGFDGVIDELRISLTERNPSSYYKSDPELDSFTSLLYHFDGKIEE